MANILNMPKEYANLDVVLDVGTAKKIMDYNPNNFRLHNLDPNTIYNALVASEDPVAVFVYKDANGKVSNNRLTLVTDVMDYKDDYIMVSFEISSGPNEKYDVNKDITIFGRKNILNQMEKAFSDNRMLHLNKEKVSLIAGSEHWLQTQPLLTEVSTNFSDNISSFWNNFKPQRDIETAKEKEPKEKEGAGRTVSDIGPRDNPKAPSYLNDTNFSEKINDLKKFFE